MSKRKRLALVLPNLGGGGAERVALELARAWVSGGYDVDLVLQRAEGELLQLVPSQVRVVDLRASRLRQAIRPLIRYLRLERPDAVQVSMWPLTIVAMIAHRLARSSSRIVLTDHSSLSRQYSGSKGWRRLLLTKGIRLFYPSADGRVAVSERAADDLATVSGIARDSINVIYNPVPSAPELSKQNAAIESLWGAKGSRILTVGRLSAEKNQALLIAAFAKLRRNGPARLMIVGDGPLREELSRIAANEGVAEDIILPGFVLDPWPYYASADLFVLSSDFEGFGLVLVEAMAAGMPIVSTDCESGPREILGDGRYGRLTHCGNAEALAEAMAAALKEPGDVAVRVARAREFSGFGAAARYLELMLGSSIIPSEAAVSRSRH